MTNKGRYYRVDVIPLPLTITERQSFVLQNCYRMRAIIFNCTCYSSLRNVSMLPTKPIVPSFVTAAHRVKHCHRPTGAYGQRGHRGYYARRWGMKTAVRYPVNTQLVSQNTIVSCTPKMCWTALDNLLVTIIYRNRSSYSEGLQCVISWNFDCGKEWLT